MAQGHEKEAVENFEGWKKEFFPEEALAAAERGTVDAIKHSLRKWTGLRHENLEKYGLLETNMRMEMGWADCALCVSTTIDADPSEVNCEHCPLFQARGGVACTVIRDDERSSPYDIWFDENDPEPMLHWLNKTMEYAENL